MIEINEYRNKKEGKVTVGQLIEGLSERVDHSEIESLVYVVKLKDGEILTAHSHGDSLGYIGLLEIGKIQILDSMRE